MDEVEIIQDLIKRLGELLTAARARQSKGIVPFTLPPPREGRWYNLPEGVHMHPNPSECCNETVEYGNPDPLFGCETDYCVKAPGHDGDHEWPFMEAYDREKG